MIDTIRQFNAEFPVMDRAVAFEARLREGSDQAVAIIRRGRKVAWNRTSGRTDVIDASYYETYEYAMLEVVGYFGSDQSRKAKLNGNPAPVSY